MSGAVVGNPSVRVGAAKLTTAAKKPADAGHRTAWGCQGSRLWELTPRVWGALPSPLAA
jgi:hypothetical protein